MNYNEDPNNPGPAACDGKIAYLAYRNGLLTLRGSYGTSTLHRSDDASGTATGSVNGGGVDSVCDYVNDRGVINPTVTRHMVRSTQYNVVECADYTLDETAANSVIRGNSVTMETFAIAANQQACTAANSMCSCVSADGNLPAAQIGIANALCDFYQMSIYLGNYSATDWTIDRPAAIRCCCTITLDSWCPAPPPS
jgi:hypothetical protein